MTLALWFCVVLCHEQDKRRNAAIEEARGQLVGLREGLQGLREAVKTDARPAVEEAVKPILLTVCMSMHYYHL